MAKVILITGGSGGIGLCTAKGLANTVVMVLGYAAAALLLAYRVAPLVPVASV